MSWANPYRPCAECGYRTSIWQNRIERGGFAKIVICPSCRYRLPEACRQFETGVPLDKIVSSMEIPKIVFLKYLRREGRLFCQGPCGESPRAQTYIHPATGAVWCQICFFRGKLECCSCKKSKRLVEFSGDYKSSSGYICRRCRAIHCTDPPQGCSESDCKTAIGKGYWPAYVHPHEPSRKICPRCYSRIKRPLRPSFACRECGKDFPTGQSQVPHPRLGTVPVCLTCYFKLSGYLESKIGWCPRCQKTKVIRAINPNNREEIICDLCFANLTAPRKIIMLSQETYTWPASYRRLFDAVVQRGRETPGDLHILRGLVSCQPYLPSVVNFSFAGLDSLRRSLIENPIMGLPRSSSRCAVTAISRAQKELFDQPDAHSRYRVLLNRYPIKSPQSSSDLLLSFASEELPALGYAQTTIDSWFYALRRFFAWLTRRHPEAYFLRQIRADHFCRYAIERQLAPSALEVLRQGWQAYCVFVSAQNHSVEALFPNTLSTMLPRRRAVLPNYVDAFRALNQIACDGSQRTFIRMVAHLLTFRAPSLREFSEATIPLHNANGVPTVKRALQNSGHILFPDTSGTRGHRINYRRLLVPLRQKPQFVNLYESMDEERRTILRMGDCPFLFVTARQRISPERPISSMAIGDMLRTVFNLTGPARS